ncbi:tetratricopeptide repeat protein [Vibrio gallaecicus]|uniref:Tetratricopeptide repeat protein n=1 Tax=Vibrio gallaecicus TaxID=552386 RepID=A0ABV4NE18_9VIBR
MFKHIYVFVVLSLINGCTSVGTPQPEPYKATASNRESMLIQSSNHNQLIELYKQQLQVAEDAETRIKLANVYLISDDFDSAIFVLESIDDLETNTSALKIKAKAKYQLRKISSSLALTKKALELQPKDGELHNLLGILYSELGDFNAAEASLNQARRYFYNDIAVKNNLATVYMLQGHYDKAVNLLTPLYQNKPEDEMVRSNLVIALVKSGDSYQAKAILKQHYKRKDLDSVLKAIEASSKVIRSGHSLPLESNYEY